ncbi:MAG: Rho termination factor N-terminal domain-containing protein, partial [Ktedonobacterales bacterium]|nr:Rho termination factor N-terminal domain-containing protein [Ktedonobacterales bacterium]
MNITELEGKTLEELRDLARELDLSGYTSLKRQDLMFRLLQVHSEQQGTIFSSGLLEIVDDGFGFLRQERFMPGNMDVYVSQSQI